MASGKQQILAINTVPFRGGAKTAIEKALIPGGGYSMIQNMRQAHPGMEQRKGCARKHTTEEGTNKVLSLYQFSKGTRTERHFFAQFENGNLLEAEDNPPTVTTGGFGNDVHDSNNYAAIIPASWSNIKDLMLYSNGADQHQIYAGTANYVTKFIKYDSADTELPDIPDEDYTDYSKEVTDGAITTFAVLDSLDTYDNNECILICTPVPANRLTWAFVAGHENDTQAVGTLSYRKSDNTWEDTEEVDNTSKDDTDTLGENGTMTWSHPDDEIPFYMFGISGFWYRWETATQLDAEVEVSSLTYGSAFQNIVNLWDGIPQYAIEARFFDNSASVYKQTAQSLGRGRSGGTGGIGKAIRYDPGKTLEQAEAEKYSVFSGEMVEIDSMVHSADDSEDRIYFCSADPIAALYIDVGDTPNTNSTSAIAGIETWTGIDWTSVGTIVDGTSGFANSGWITWGRPTTAAKPVQFQKSRYLAYWYYIYVSTATLSSDVQISIETMPFFDIKEAGEVGKASCAWKGRGTYTFDRYPWYVYVSAGYNPLMLNGNDFAIFESGDGRTNPVVCMKQFYNELLVFQEERGVEGGCITLFEGNAVDNYGKVLVTSKVGTFSAKSAVVVDGVLTSTATEEKLKTLGFFLNRYGMGVTDGMSVSIVTDDIRNYFDPKKSECIRRGYEKENFIFHDTCDNVLRLGLVSGEPVLTSTTTSTVPYKLVDTAGAFTTKKELTTHPITHKIAKGDTVYNTTDATTALVVSVNSSIELTLDTDIMASEESEEGYEIYSATPNLFPVFDLVDKTWSFDVLGVNLSCMCEVEAASGEVAILQYGGGVGGHLEFSGVCHLNTGTNDVDIDNTSHAIDAFATMELDYGGNFLALRKMLLRVKSQAAGNVIVTPSRNTREGTAVNLPMTAETTGDAFRRHKIGMDVQDPHISLKFQNATASQELYLLDVGYELYAKPSH